MTEVRVVQADITTLEVDAVVNAANAHLQHGGGVALSISRAGGGIIQQASDDWVRKHGPLGPDDAALTPGGNLPAPHVIHVAGPRYRKGQDNADLLARAVNAALRVATEAGCRSIALPAISAGIFGYPLTDATRVIVDAVGQWCAANPEAFDSVFLVGYDRRVATAFEEALAD